MKGEAIVKIERGREIAGNGISQKCRTGRHEGCAAERCQCTECGHRATPEERLAEIEQDLLYWSEGEDFKAPPINNLRLERKGHNDETTFAGITASLGRRGTTR